MQTSRRSRYCLQQPDEAVRLIKKSRSMAETFLLIHGCLLVGVGLHIDKFAAGLAGREYHNAVDEGKQGVVLAHTYIKARVVLCATLALDDVSGFAFGSTEDFYAEAFAF